MDIEPVMPKNVDIEDILDEIGSYYIDDDFNFICPSFRSYSTRVSWDGTVSSSNSSEKPALDSVSVPNQTLISTPAPAPTPVPALPPPASDLIENRQQEDENPTTVIHQTETETELNTLENFVPGLQPENAQSTDCVKIVSPRRKRRKRQRRFIRLYGKANYDRMKTDPEFKLQFLKHWKEQQQQQQNKETANDQQQDANTIPTPTTNNNGNDTDDTLVLSFQPQDSEKDMTSSGSDPVNPDSDKPEPEPEPLENMDLNADLI